MIQLKPGDRAPDFALTDQAGRRVTLADFAGRCLFIYFYPKAGTSGCTIQSQALRDALPTLTDIGVAVAGISPDDAAAGIMPGVIADAGRDVRLAEGRGC